MNDQDTLSRGTKTIMVLFAVAALASVVVGVVLLATKPKREAHAIGLRGSVLPEGLEKRAAPRLVGRDERGRRIDTAMLAGKPYMVTFLYTRCPDVCPLIGEEIREALSGLGPRARDTAVVAVSVDPRGDTPEAVALWLKRHREPANFHYIIGSKAELTPLWTRYFVSPQVAERPEASTHSASIWLVDAKGRLRTDYSAGGVVAPADLVHDLRALQDER